MNRTVSTAALIIAALAGPAMAQDFGAEVEALMLSRTQELFGVASALDQSAPPTEGAYRTEAQQASDQLALAEGLTVRYLTRQAAQDLDMFALFPAASPTHLIACIEGEREELADGRLNPSVQRIALADGTVETVLRGMDSCDGIRTTPWGTVLATEEVNDGGAYEILDVLNLTDAVVSDRDTGEVSDPARVAKRDALPKMAWEGLDITPQGVVIAGDELRPGTGYPDVDGGAIFKFLPATPHAGGLIDSLDASPLTAGSSHALQVSCVSGRAQSGQGCEIGNASWVAVDPARARITADLGMATGYYRPEDLHFDPTFAGEGIRFCWTNTGNEGARNYAEVVCGIDSAPLSADAGALSVVVNRFVEGDGALNSADNLAFHPVSGMHYVIEDHDNGDVWACLPDGADRDIKTDGCIRVLSVRDSSAEPTGFMFSPDGSTAYVSIQHSDDTNMPLVDGYATDDLVIVSGFSR